MLRRCDYCSGYDATVHHVIEDGWNELDVGGGAWFVIRCCECYVFRSGIQRL